MEDILNICGESWKRKSGVRRTLFSIIDIVILTAIFVFYFINFTSSRVQKIVGSLLVLLKFVRSFKVGAPSLSLRFSSWSIRKPRFRTISASDSIETETSWETVPWT